MEILFTDQYHETIFDPISQIHQHTAKPATVNMSEEEFKDMIKTWKETVFKANPTYLLIDNRDLNFPISPTLQEWVMMNAGIPAMNLSSVKKLCFVIPKELISRLSVTQLSDDQEKIVESAEMAYFDNLESAHTWLLK